jgi:hypothetical protein
MMARRAGCLGCRIRDQLDSWLAQPTLRVAHDRTSRASQAELWQAARAIRMRDTQLLGRLVRWRIPGTQVDLTYDELFRQPPFLVLAEAETALMSGLVGRIWTLRRDYPRLAGPDEFCAWSRRGTVRVLFAMWAERRGDGGSRLCSEVRVQAFGRQGRIGLATVRPLVSTFQHVIGTDGMAAAVRRAERCQPVG